MTSEIQERIDKLATELAEILGTLQGEETFESIRRAYGLIEMRGLSGQPHVVRAIELHTAQIRAHNAAAVLNERLFTTFAERAASDARAAKALRDLADSMGLIATSMSKIVERLK